MSRRLTLIGFVLLLATSAASAQDEPRFRTEPWTLFAGAGTDFDSYSLALGLRWGPWGIGGGYRHNTETLLPDYSTEGAPAIIAEEKTFAVTAVGLDLYTSHSLAGIVNGYATIGGYADVNTILVRDSSNMWFRSEKSPDWTNARVAYGAGLEINPVEWLAIGLGYHSVRGFNAHLGYVW